MGQPLAYLLTWTCRGTWLHGDPRGSIERLEKDGTRLLEPDPERLDLARTRSRTKPVALDQESRDAVARIIDEHCRVRGWPLFAPSVLSNHAHVVVRVDGPPEPVMQQLKSWSTRILREHGHLGPVWTRHGSTKYLWDQHSVNRAVLYVREGQTGAFVIARENSKKKSRACARGLDQENP
ncbi:MAG: REP element-mobilizing transposase RayT [Phycisphaerales bacterium]|jgi:REP element-mobilizing transposase RayT